MDSVTLAFLLGGLSAASLPLGAAFGIWLNPGLRLTAAVMAFGAGALLCALALELVVPALAHFPDNQTEGFLWLALGAMIGCVLFLGLDHSLSEMGGYLRKVSTIASRLKRLKKQHYRKILDKLSVLDLMVALPPDEIRRVVSDIEKRHFRGGELICHEEDPCDALFLIESGKVRILPHVDEGVGEASIVGKGEAFGELALVTGLPPIARAEAVEDTIVWEIHKDDFNEVVEVSPGLQQTLGRLAGQNHQHGATNDCIDPERSRAWLEAASQDLETELGEPTEAEIMQAASAQKTGGSNVALAIWLGIALDGIPESLIIGSTMEDSKISMALIGGLFIANLPESMSSAVVMKKQGGRSWLIMMMWLSLMIMTAVGSAMGNVFIADAPNYLRAILEGMATGLMTVIGFLTAIWMGTLGH
jgi:CRP-like cAMP-binding protein